jgi:hypothetical protein
MLVIATAREERDDVSVGLSGLLGFSTNTNRQLSLPAEVLSGHSALKTSSRPKDQPKRTSWDTQRDIGSVRGDLGVLPAVA